MWKQTGSGQIFITFLFTAMPETKKVYGILMRSARRIPVILKSGTGKRRRVSWHYGATGDGSKGEGLYQGMQGARSAIRRPRAPEMGNGNQTEYGSLVGSRSGKVCRTRVLAAAGQYLDVASRRTRTLWTVMDFGSSVRRPIPMRYHVSDTVCAWTGAVHFPRGRDKLLCNGMQNLGAV